MSHPPALTWASRGDLVVIRPRGYLNRRLGREVAILVERRMSRGSRDFLVDLEESDTVNHFGLAELFDLEARLRRGEATLRLRGGTPTVRKILRILGLETEAAAPRSSSSI